MYYTRFIRRDARPRHLQVLTRTRRPLDLPGAVLGKLQADAVRKLLERLHTQTGNTHAVSACAAVGQPGAEPVRRHFRAIGPSERSREEGWLG
jgi:hypothetical protein